ncbi:K(+)-transporting ATPase subunit F [Methanocella conradii]|nr:K(+)-transporting ATPase subunit F [Methanocella conradii]
MTGCSEMIGEVIVIIAVIVAFVYLFYALLRPEKF